MIPVYTLYRSYKNLVVSFSVGHPGVLSWDMKILVDSVQTAVMVKRIKNNIIIIT